MALVTKMNRCAVCGSSQISLMGGSTEEIEALRHRYPRLGLTTWTKENRVQL